MPGRDAYLDGLLASSKRAADHFVIAIEQFAFDEAPQARGWLA
jgi:hypothetical protein